MRKARIRNDTRVPGVEPGSNAWKQAMITAIQCTLHMGSITGRYTRSAAVPHQKQGSCPINSTCRQLAMKIEITFSATFPTYGKWNRLGNFT